MTLEDFILVLDNGSQTTQLIAKRLRKRGYYAEVVPFNASLETIAARKPKGIVLSGSPASVHDAKAPSVDKRIYSIAPVLGICYGTQFTGQAFGGEVEHSEKREYGPTEIDVDTSHLIFKNVPGKFKSWMSHGDKVVKLPHGFSGIAETGNCQYAAIAGPNFVGLQFHPEVTHTEYGADILENFAREICGMQPNWTPANFITNAAEEIKKKVGDTLVVGGQSGGVDSTTMGFLLHRILGSQYRGIFVNNGLLRKGEAEEVMYASKRNDLNLIYVDASERFLAALKGVTDSDEKRKIIGREFIHVFKDTVEKNFDVRHTYLAQGTLYTDVIESVSVYGGPTSKIGRHHNVGGLPPETLSMFKAIIEPFRFLFKDDVREIAHELGMPEEIIKRHPFPGPGLAVRIVGEITPDRLYIARESDSIVVEELKDHNLYDKVWQALTVVTDTRTRGVMGDEGTYSYVVGIRCVDSVDGMTADWSRLPHDFLAHVSNRITNEVKGVNRVVLDISSKPPATIEWH